VDLGVPGDLAVVIACASMALADAGIEMYDMVPAISAVCIFTYTKQRY
jgi:ribonuclease PH